MSRPVLAALYARVSTRAQADKHGVAYQLAALRQMAEARGWVVVREDVDEGWSGRLASRPGLDAMMTAIRRREVDVVAVWRFDRLARSVSHLVGFLSELRSLGLSFVSHQEALDTNTPLGMAMFQIAAAMAELEASLARERVQAGVDAARARGVRLGRPRAGLSPAKAAAALTEHGSIRKAAKALGVSPTLLARRAREHAPPLAA
ncbi:recombinase family protein [Myxococcota bacterium]|nr:recombinase family protein [Myxococcota bacterium]